MGSGARLRRRVRRHVIDMALTRYGLKLDLEDVGNLNRAIKFGASTEFGKARKHAERHFLTYKCMELPVMYDVRLETVSTILPWNGAEVIRAMEKRAVLFSVVNK